MSKYGMVFLFLTLLLSTAACEESESQKIKKIELPDIDLSVTEDGRYTGEFTHHDSLYETEVFIKGHRIDDIRVLHCEGDEYDEKALEVIRRVIEAQSLRVDTVTGATKSSMLYLITIYYAVSSEELEIR
jgi:uncharacterized protein with FMN-binding domain